MTCECAKFVQCHRIWMSSESEMNTTEKVHNGQKKKSCAHATFSKFLFFYAHPVVTSESIDYFLIILIYNFH